MPTAAHAQPATGNRLPTADFPAKIITIAERDGQKYICNCQTLTFGRALATARDTLGFSVGQLAEASGLGVRSLHAYESGDHRVPLATRLQLAAALQAHGIATLAAGRPLERLLKEVGLL